MRALLILAGAAVVASVWWAQPWRSEADDAAAAVGPAPAASPALVAGPSTSSTATGGAADGAVTISDAMGLTMDAARLFQLGFGGGLVVDADTRASIEALVNALPPEPSAQDLERLERTLRAGLPKEEAEKAYKLVNGYRSYTREVQREMMPLGIPQTREQAAAFFDQMDSVKRRHFDGATAQALFGDDDRYARLSMEASFVQMDGALSPDQKRQAIEALRAQLPADKREMIPPFDAAASQPSS
ncbi:MAG TPA: lipase secretion chaperone [Rhizobacter sp.]|nr:lipase secretion chaperone [Rhizobacter sp.]